MTTSVAVDRIVHHAVILELTGPTYRAEAANARVPKEALGGLNQYVFHHYSSMSFLRSSLPSLK